MALFPPSSKIFLPAKKMFSYDSGNVNKVQ